MGVSTETGHVNVFRGNLISCGPTTVPIQHTEQSSRRSRVFRAVGRREIPTLPSIRRASNRQNPPVRQAQQSTSLPATPEGTQRPRTFQAAQRKADVRFGVSPIHPLNHFPYHRVSFTTDHRVSFTTALCASTSSIRNGGPVRCLPHQHIRANRSTC